ncbi:hypothetical protein [Streptomyces sp. NPDC059570]|uniref:hypothetical protein n=1 Tax=unclassified Streptomyces TaxID=2593676 RepID=UPI00367832BC
MARTAGAGSVALLIAVAIPSAAQAASDPEYAGCSTTGARGFLKDVQLTDEGPAGKHAVHIEITDTLADGHNARVRYLTKTGTGTIRYWSWHANNVGANTTVTVDTTAQDSAHGIFNAGIQVARAVGSDVSNSTTCWVA